MDPRQHSTGKRGNSISQKNVYEFLENKFV